MTPIYRFTPSTGEDYIIDGIGIQDFVDDFFTSEEKAKVVPLAIENLNEITNDELEKPEKVWLYVRVEKDNSSIDSVCKKISLSQLKDFIKS